MVGPNGPRSGRLGLAGGADDAGPVAQTTRVSGTDDSGPVAAATDPESPYQQCVSEFADGNLFIAQAFGGDLLADEGTELV